MPADPVPAAILRQLKSPNPTGRDLALLRTRLYRFSDDPRHYVLAEALEERLLAGQSLRPETITYVRDCLTAIRASGQPPPFHPAITAAENIDIAAELSARAPYYWQQIPPVPAPRRVIMIVGAPRSGTSHMFNLLARTGLFAYLTTASCWAWPVRNLGKPGRHLFTQAGDDVLAVDNKRTRVIPGLVMPGEVEDMWERAIPVYQHIAGHRYNITPAGHGQPAILNAAASAHLRHFRQAVLLTKTPFSSFRIPQIEALWGDRIRYLHMVRDLRETADSMRRNHFEFAAGGRPLPAQEAAAFFADAVRENAPADRTLTITHRELLQDQHRLIANIFQVLAIKELLEVSDCTHADSQ